MGAEADRGQVGAAAARMKHQRAGADLLAAFVAVGGARAR